MYNVDFDYNVILIFLDGMRLDLQPQIASVAIFIKVAKIMYLISNMKINLKLLGHKTVKNRDISAHF